MKKNSILILSLVGILFVGSAFALWWNAQLVEAEPERVPIYLRPLSTIPVPILEPVAQTASPSGALTTTDLTITAQTAYIADLDSGAVLYAKNEHLAWAPASTTKLLTALVTLEAYSLSDELPVTTESETPGTTIGFSTGETFTVESILKALLISSANDAAYVLANNYPGGYDSFIARMNARARELGMYSSYFDNPAGFDSDRQYSSAYDLYILSKAVTEVPILREIVATRSALVSTTQGTKTYQLDTTNRLLIENAQVVGIKTGTTQNAGQVLISHYQLEDGRNIVVVLMGSTDRFSDTAAVAEWVFARYDWKLISTPE